MDAASQPRERELGAGSEPSTRKRLYRAAFQVLGTGTFYVLVLVGFSLTSRHFLTYSNALNVLSNVTVVGIVSLGQALTIISGGFDLSVAHGATGRSDVHACGQCRNADQPRHCRGRCRRGAGRPDQRADHHSLKINPLITTLGTMSIGVGLAYTLSNGVTIPFADPDAGVLADKAIGDVAWYLISFLLLTVVLFLVSRFTVFGRMLYAVGGNREASRLAGLRVDLITVAVYMLCAALATFAGMVVACQLLAGSATVGADAALSSIASVVLGGASLTGGVGGIPGTLIGVLILGTIANGMALLQVPAFYQQIATGLILLLGVGFARLREVLSGEQI